MSEEPAQRAAGPISRREKDARRQEGHILLRLSVLSTYAFWLPSQKTGDELVCIPLSKVPKTQMPQRPGPHDSGGHMPQSPGAP